MTAEKRPILLEIASGGWRAGVRPEAGGALGFLTHHDIDVLRPMPAGSTAPMQAACFPLVPFAGRIRRGRFRFGRRDVVLPPTVAGDRHALHGTGWLTPWRVEEYLGGRIVLALDHAAPAHGAPGWPWPWHAEQAFAIDEAGLAITLSLTNTGDEQMPAGLGLSPGVRRWSDSRVRFSAGKVVLNDIEAVPTGELGEPGHFAAWDTGPLLPFFTVDHCHADWGGVATITDGLGSITMRATGAPNLHVLAPSSGRALRLAPVNHLPDALNQGWPMPLLEPGESTSITMRIEGD